MLLAIMIIIWDGSYGWKFFFMYSIYFCIYFTMFADREVTFGIKRFFNIINFKPSCIMNIFTVFQIEKQEEAGQAR